MSPVKSEMRCSFCGKPYTDVTKLIAGPGVYICEGCVNLCVDILAEATEAQPPSLPEWATLSDDELLQRIPFIAASADNIDTDFAIAFTNCAIVASPGPGSARRWA
jgi:ATP-dependent Clp protease ATP-binding subunit ClpX